MAKFSMADLLNNKSKEGSSNKNTFKIKNISIDKIVPDKKNFYSVADVTELKETIFMFGLQQNLVVREVPGDKFKLISGHRRLKALTMLVEEGHEDFKVAPCKIETNLDEIKAELQLIFANATSRELSDYEKTHQAMRMKELLTSLKNSGVKLTGRMRELVADTLKVSPAQVGRMESINNNLTPSFKDEFRNNKVNFSTAYELSGLAEKEQEEAYKEFKDKGTLSIKDVKNRKTEKDKKEKEQVDQRVSKSTESTTHELKILPQYFKAVAEGKKPFEYRLNDRGFKVNDNLLLREYNEKLSKYTGNLVQAEITYILENIMNLPRGYAILGIKIIN